MPGTSAIEICQLKPIGAKTTSSARPSMNLKTAVASVQTG
jgi:hypothetical protein